MGQSAMFFAVVSMLSSIVALVVSWVALARREELKAFTVDIHWDRSSIAGSFLEGATERRRRDVEARVRAGVRAAIRADATARGLVVVTPDSRGADVGPEVRAAVAAAMEQARADQAAAALAATNAPNTDATGSTAP